MRFKLDENIPLELREVLRVAGHDAQTVLDQGLGGFGDQDIAAACRREGRVIITFNVVRFVRWTPSPTARQACPRC